MATIWALTEAVFASLGALFVAAWIIGARINRRRRRTAPPSQPDQ